MSTPPDQFPDRGLVVQTDDNPEGTTTSNDAGSKAAAESQARLKQIRERFQVHQTFWSPIHNEALDDDKFIAGEHWPEQIKRDREADRRPCLTYNLLPAFVRQITNKVRESRPQIKVIPVDTHRGQTPKLPNVGGTRDYALTEVYSGLIKHVEHVSRADQAYDTALKHAADHGFGWFYLMNEFSRVDPFVQELRIHRVKNAYSVMMDPDAQEADYRDAQDAFMFGSMKRSTFEAKYPDAMPLEYAGAVTGLDDGWYDGENIRIAQYFWIAYQDDEVLMLNNGKTVYLSEVEDVLDELKQVEGVHIAKDTDGEEMRKRLKRPVCMYQKMTAHEILEGPLELPFSAIPIFPVFGEEVMTDGRVQYESAIRHAKDAARSYNYWRTAAAETVALAPRAPWVATPRQVAGFEQMYEEANSKNIPVLLYNPHDNAPPPQRQFPTQVAAAELQNAVADASDMQAIIGLHEASLGAESNEKSGRAIKARQSQGFTATFQFPDNLNRAQEQCGRLMVEAFPRIMDTQRIIRIRLPDDTDDFVEINQAVRDEESGRTVLVHDIAYGKYDVTLDTGPAYQTQREEAAALQMELLQVLGPDMARNIVHLIVENLGTPGSAEVAAVLRKMLPDALKSEDERLADLPKGVTMDDETGQLMKDGQPYQPPPTLEQQIAMKQQEIDELRHTAETEKHRATQAKAAADRAEAEAELAQLQAQQQVGQAEGADQEAGSGAMLEDIRAIIEEVMEAHQEDPQAHAGPTEDRIAEAVVDALKRTRSYVDRTLAERRQAEPSRPSSPPAPPAPIVVPAPAPAWRVPIRVEHRYNDEGEITESVPIFEEPNQ